MNDVFELVEEYRCMYMEEEQARAEAEERADEMQRLVYVVWTSFAPHLPEVAAQLQAEEPYLADEFYEEDYR